MNVLKFVVRLMAIGGIVLYCHNMLYFPIDPVKVTPILILKISIVAILGNIGLIFISLNIARKYKLVTTLAFLPSVLITPIIAGLYFIPAFIIVLILNICLFIKLNPWKKDERTIYAS
ncbi:MAG: hypothetical protein U0T83_02995 [Bacteriovoracaceae bacterium]